MAPDDVADAVTAVLTTGNGDHDGVTYRLTGPEAFTLTEAAETITRVTGRSVRFENETLDEAYASRAHFGGAGLRGRRWVTSYAAIAAGELAVVTGGRRGAHRAAAADLRRLSEQLHLTRPGIASVDRSLMVSSSKGATPPRSATQRTGAGSNPRS